MSTSATRLKPPATPKIDYKSRMLKNDVVDAKVRGVSPLAAEPRTVVPVMSSRISPRGPYSIKLTLRATVA